MPTTTTSTTPGRTTRSGLLLHDGLVFLALCGVTIALFIVTLLLFRSFEAHREELGRRWARRGEAALLAGHPQEAVGALRTALTYRDGLPERLMLAQALAQAGRTEEAENYYLTLREAQPGDGMINLQLARLARKEGDASEAIDYYRASIFGTWGGDGALRRKDVRLELAGYLAERKDISSARDELLTAAGNMPESSASDVQFGDRLQEIGDQTDAMNFYNRALTLEHPDASGTLARAGRLAYAMGQYAEANRWLTAAADELKTHGHENANGAELALLAANARRIPELNLSRALPPTERAAHLLDAAGIAQRRLKACIPPTALAASPSGGRGTAKAAPGAVVPPATATPVDPVLMALSSRWAAVAPQLTAHTVSRDAMLQDDLQTLIDNTEEQTVAPCGAATGDDALLLMQAKAHPAT